jgi:hypothetical protein
MGYLTENTDYLALAFLCTQHILDEAPLVVELLPSFPHPYPDILIRVVLWNLGQWILGTGTTHHWCSVKSGWNIARIKRGVENWLSNPSLL